MKQKKTMRTEKAGQNPQPAPETQSAAATGESGLGESNAALLTGWEQAALWLFPVLLFFAMTLQSGWSGVVFAGIALVLSIGKAPLRNLRGALSLPVLGLVCYAVLNGFAAIYSPFGGYAAREFAKILASAALAFLVLTRFRKEQSRGLLWGFSGVCAAISMICVDAGGSQRLYNGYVALLTRLGNDFEQTVAWSGQGMQINGIFNNANLTGNLLALGMLACLHLAITARGRRSRLAGCFLLGVNAMGFFLSMSRGAILSFAVAALVYLAAVGREKRLPLLFLLFFSAAVTVALSTVCIPFLGKGGVLPDLLTLSCGVGIFLLDWGVGDRLTARLAGRGKGVALAAGAVCVLCVGYAVAGVAVTGPYTMTDSGSLFRTVSLDPGEYTLSGDWDKEITLAVQSRSAAETLRTLSTSLYAGPADQAAFTVPEEAEAVDVIFYGTPGLQVREATLSDGTQLKLGFPLLPDFLVNRMQGGILKSSSFLLRWQYMKDGLTLFAQSPLLGHGLGSSEGLLTSVQPFFYETLYIHNHLIQAMDDMGLLGLAAMLTMMLGAALVLLRRLRGGTDVLAAMLLAALVMLNLHGLMEITFSVRSTQCAAFLVLAITAMCYGREGSAEQKPQRRAAAGLGTWAVLGVMWAFLAVFGGLYASHLQVQTLARTQGVENAVEFMDTNASFVRRDVFDHEQFQINYVGNAVLLDSSRYNGTARKYAEKLRSSGTYTACSALARYYYLPRNELDELFAVSRQGIAQEASAKDAWNLQFDFYRDEVLPAITAEQLPEFLAGVQGTAAYLAEFSQGRMEEIELTEETQAFLTAVDSVRAQRLDNEAGYDLLSLLSVAS